MNLTKKINEKVFIKFLNIPEFFKNFFPSLDIPDYRTSRNITLSHESFQKDIFSPSEIEKLNSFKTLKKQVEWSSGRFAVKSLISELYPEIDFKEIEISYEKEGAPYLKEFSEWNISISHSHDFAAAMISFDSEINIGIDIEKMENRNIDNILKVAYSEDELNNLNRDNLKDVYKIWTGKEAYLKLIKKGFHETIKNIEVLGERIFFKKSDTGVNFVTDFIDEEHIYSYVIKNQS